MRTVIWFFSSTLLFGCKSDKWKAQTCSPVTSSCSEINYGPYDTLDKCIEKMQNVGWGFNCAQGCDDKTPAICVKVMRYTVEQNGESLRVIPNPSNP